MKRISHGQMSAPTLLFTLMGVLSGLPLFGCGSGDGGDGSGYAQCATNPVYVHPAGSDSGDGSLADPFATLGRALSCAYGQEIRVAEGIYDVVVAMTQNPDVTLKGGYSSSDFSVRDPTTYPTVINVSTMTGSAITALFGEKRLGLIDGFVFNDLRSGIPTLITAEVTVSNNIFNCTGTCVAGRGLITNNTMNNGVTAIIADGYDVLNNNISSNMVNATGIWFNGSLGGTQRVAHNTIELTSGGTGIKAGVPGTLIVEANVIRVTGGDGIFVTQGSQTLRNNVVWLSSSGVGINDSEPSTKIWNNTIVGAAGGNYEGIRAVSGDGSYVNNLIVLAMGICLREYALTSDPARFENNDLSGCTDLYRDEVDTNYQTIGEVNAMNDTVAAGNLSVDPSLSVADASLTASSPNSVTQGGVDLSTDFTTDIMGYTRTPLWSMGAYEYD